MRTTSKMTSSSRLGVLAQCAGVGVIALVLASSTAQAQQCPGTCTSTNGCNAVSSETILAPDQGRPFTVYVNLRTTCQGAVVKSCSSPFPVGAEGETMTREMKCQKLVDAINGFPACVAAGYVVTTANNTCAMDRKFTVTDSGLNCTGSVLELGISNNNDIFNQAGAGPIPDYEAELIAPGCKDEDNTPGNGNEMTHQITLAGSANGVPIVEEEPAHVEVVVDMTPSGGTIHTAEVNTTVGMTASAMTQTLGNILASQGVPCQVSGRSLRILQFPTGRPLRAGVGISDEGFTSDSRVAPLNLLPRASAATTPALSPWGTMALITLLAAMGMWIIQRRLREPRSVDGN